MDTFSNTDFTSFLNFCQSLDSEMVHTPEQALELYRARREGRNGASTSPSSNLGRDLIGLRKEIVASGAPLLSETKLDDEIAARRGEQVGKD